MFQLVLVLSMAALVGIDQLTKYLVVLYIEEGEAIPVISEVFEFLYTKNTGAAFGILKDQPWIFMSITTVVLIAVIALLMSGKYRQHMLVNISGVLIAAGGIGNMIDRIFLGYVVDFLYFKPINFPVFNFADCCVVIGAVLLLIFFFFFYSEEKKKDTDQQTVSIPTAETQDVSLESPEKDINGTDSPQEQEEQTESGRATTDCDGTNGGETP